MFLLVLFLFVQTVRGRCVSYSESPLKWEDAMSGCFQEGIPLVVHEEEAFFHYISCEDDDDEIKFCDQPSRILSPSLVHLYLSSLDFPGLDVSVWTGTNENVSNVPRAYASGVSFPLKDVSNNENDVHHVLCLYDMPPTPSPSTLSPTSLAPTSLSPTSHAPSTHSPTSLAPSSLSPTSLAPTSQAPTSVMEEETTPVPTSLAPTSPETTFVPTASDQTLAPTLAIEEETTSVPTVGDLTQTPTMAAPGVTPGPTVNGTSLVISSSSSSSSSDLSYIPVSIVGGFIVLAGGFFLYRYPQKRKAVVRRLSGLVTRKESMPVDAVAHYSNNKRTDEFMYTSARSIKEGREDPRNLTFIHGKKRDTVGFYVVNDINDV
jgi:hypothetical protein